MNQNAPVTVRMFGSLWSLRRERGLPLQCDIEIESEGVTASELARRLDLPLEMIEGVFCNRVVYGMGHIIHPGDRVAFVPQGTPGPHRFFLGLYAAGKEGEGSEAACEISPDAAQSD